MDLVITEYMTVSFKSLGMLESTTADLEELLDQKGRMGWKLFNITYVHLDSSEIKAVLIFERGLTHN